MLSATLRRKAALGRFACLALISVMIGWGLFGLALVGVRYAQDLAGAEREARDIQDYVVFYSAARLVLEGHGDQLYDLESIGAAETEAMGTPVQGEDIYPYLNPPFVAAALAPFSLLPPVAFGMLLGIVSLALLVAAGLGLMRQLALTSGIQRWLFWLTYLTGFSVVTLLWHQQFTPLVLAGWLAFVSFQLRGEERLSGAALALALVKPQFVLLPLAFLLLHRRWEALRAFAAVAAALVLVSVGVSGPGVLIDYPSYVLTSTEWTENGIFSEYMLGWHGLLVDVTGDDTPSRALFLALALPTVALAAWTWRGSWQERLERLPMLMAAALLATLLVTPHLFLHDMLLGLLAIGLAALDRKRRTGTLGPWGALAVVFWLTQMPRSFFYYTDLPLLTLFTFGLFLLMVRDLAQGDTHQAEARLGHHQASRAAA